MTRRKFELIRGSGNVFRNADLGRFTADRLVSILNRLGSRVKVKIRVRRLEPPPRARPEFKPIGIFVCTLCATKSVSLGDVIASNHGT